MLAGSAHALPLPPAQAAALARADSLGVIGQFAAATKLLDSLDAAATAREDARLRNAVQVSRARMAVGGRRLDETERIVRPLLERLQAAHDTLLWVRAMRIEARLLALRGRPRESASAYRAAIRTAKHRGFRQEQVLGEMAAAATAIETGRYTEAVDGYRRALAALGEGSDTEGRMRARAGLARAFQGLGQLEESRREHARVLELAVQIRNLTQQAETHLNVGALENSYGDLSKAEAHYLEALRLYREMSWADRRLAATLNLAILRLNAGRTADADSILTAELPIAFRPDVSVDRRVRMFCQVGIVRREQGRMEDGITWGRRAVAPMDSVSVVTAVEVVDPLLGTLQRAGRITEAVALIDTALRRLDARLTAALRGHLILSRARLMALTGRVAEALPPMIAGIGPVAPGGSFGYDTIDLMSDIGLAYGALGKRDSAIAWHRRASESWELWRGRSAGTSSWREVIDNAAQRFAGRYAAAILADPEELPSARVAAAFDALQRHRARTLAERMSDPARGRTPVTTPVHASRLKSVLRPGELFLDVHATPETTLVIAVSRDTVAAWGAPRRPDLAQRLERLRDLLGTPGSSATVRDAAAAALGRDLFGPGAVRIARASSVVVSAGALAQYPLGMLAMPGVAQPLAGRLSFVPSATLLTSARSRPPVAASGGLLAIARTRDEAGRELRGAREEAQWLAARFQGAEARVDDDGLPPAAIGRVTARAQVLHFAAHARDDAKRPWRSGLLLGSPGAANPWLEAWDVARFHPAARLCVLTGCESVGGRGDIGETLEGLATAWLAAGVPTAIASQWDVDDASSATFVRRFYTALARGESAGASLREAQEHLRNVPATADPCHWAGFVTLGDPETRVRLRAR